MGLQARANNRRNCANEAAYHLLAGGAGQIAQPPAFLHGQKLLTTATPCAFTFAGAADVEMLGRCRLLCLAWAIDSQAQSQPIYCTLSPSLHRPLLQGIGPGGPPKADHYSVLRAEMAELGYDAQYVRKTDPYAGGHPGPNLGNAVFWKRETFEFLSEHTINYADLLGARATTDASRW